MATTVVAHRLVTDPGVIQLAGSLPDDHEALLKLPTQRDFKIEVTLSRNLKFHKKYFALMRAGYDYMDDGRRAELGIWNPETLRLRVQMDLGLFDLWIAPHDLPGGIEAGTPLLKPQSISFASMDETAFDRMYRGAIGVLIGKYTTNQTEASMMQAVDAILRFE